MTSSSGVLAAFPCLHPREQVALGGDTTGSGTLLVRELHARGSTTRRGAVIGKGFLYRLLNNRAYIGGAVHKGESYPGEHEGIIDRDTWDKVHAILTESPRKRAANTRAQTPALLKGLLWGPDGAAFSPTHARKGGRLCRYYVSQTLLRHETSFSRLSRRASCSCWWSGRRPERRASASACASMASKLAFEQTPLAQFENRQKPIRLIDERRQSAARARRPFVGGGHGEGWRPSLRLTPASGPAAK